VAEFEIQTGGSWGSERGPVVLQGDDRGNEWRAKSLDA
jgi:hypothetical protein